LKSLDGSLQQEENRLAEARNRLREAERKRDSGTGWKIGLSFIPVVGFVILGIVIAEKKAGQRRFSENLFFIHFFLTIMTFYKKLFFNTFFSF
jgi:hypothetical protein